MGKKIKIGDTIKWSGDYYSKDAFNGDLFDTLLNKHLYTEHQSGVNKIVSFKKIFGRKSFELDNGKIFFFDCPEDWEKVPYDKCISCGKETPYTIDTPIDLRENYIEGVGQTCEKCNHEIYKHGQ